MAEVRLISTSIVQTVSHHGKLSGDRIELTPWDLQFLLLGPIQKGLLFLKPQENELPSNTVVDHLKISFSRALEFFPPLTSRLGVIQYEDDTSSFFVDCNNAGAQFVHAVVDEVTVSDILEPVHVPQIVHSLFPLNGVSNYHGISDPLLAVQVNELVDGFFIGCTMNHVVVDGSSFWNFFNAWSDISRGMNTISLTVSFTRWFPSEIGCPIRIPFCSEEEDHNFILPRLEERVFHFLKAKIATLKAKANAEMSTITISSLQALLAHLWRAVVRCQRVDGNQEVAYAFLASARLRLQPSLPEGYFGNTIHCEIVSTTAGELGELGLGWVAWQLNQKISLQTNVGVRNFLKCWVKNPKLLKMGTLSKKALTTSSSPRFNVYGNDFGWGKPVAVRSGLANKSDRKITLFPGVEDGSIDVEVCLSPDKLLAMEDDYEFMEAVK